MTCPTCLKEAKQTNSEGRDTDCTRRRYVCRKCGVVLITHEKVVVKAKLHPRK
jgi:transcriptional regulator NrdR family protein